MERLHHHPIRLCGQVGDLAGLIGVGSEWLFTQHVLAGGQRGPGPPAVQAVRQRVVDGVDIGIGDQRLVAFVHPRDVVFGGERLRARRIAGCHRSHYNFGVFLGRLDKSHRCDVGRTQDADTNLSGHGLDASTEPRSLRFRGLRRPRPDRGRRRSPRRSGPTM